MNTKSRTLLFIGIIFILPTIFAFMLFWNAPRLHLSQTNRGQLLSKPIAIDTLAFHPMNRPQNSITMPKKWILLWIFENMSSLNHSVDAIWRARLSLGRDFDRTQTWVWVKYPALKSKISVETFDFKGRDGKQTVVDRWLETTKCLSLFCQKANGLYLVDPLGNIMMHYGTKLSVEDVHHDLKRLLKVSNIG